MVYVWDVGEQSPFDVCVCSTIAQYILNTQHTHFSLNATTDYKPTTVIKS